MLTYHMSIALYKKIDIQQHINDITYTLTILLLSSFFVLFIYALFTFYL